MGATAPMCDFLIFHIYIIIMNKEERYSITPGDSGGNITIPDFLKASRKGQPIRRREDLTPS
jgi:hypothetical protein